MHENTEAAESLKPHWMKAELAKRNVPVVWLSMRIDVAYPTLVKMLNRRGAMTPEVEASIRRVISDVYRDPLPDGEAAA